MSYTKVIDATSGAATHILVNQEALQFSISGTPNSNILIFIEEIQTNAKNLARIKFKCDDWNGATVEVKYKTNHPDDDFSETGHTLYKNDTKTFEF